MSYSGSMADTITFRTDEETEHALDVLTRDGSSRSAAIRQAVLEAASRRERAAEMRREVLRMNLGQPSVSRFHFRITDSFANGPCCANIATITLWLGDSGATITVDCVVIYTVDDSGRITSIRAHWEPDRALATLTGP